MDMNMVLGGRILVVDDNLQNRLLAEAQLDAAGYKVTLAEDGMKALEYFEREEFDLILLDVMMPGLNGFETCARLRSHPRGADVPVLFLTASQATDLERQATTSGGDDFLRKPIDRTELLLRVRSLIRITRLQRELRREKEALLKLQKQKELLGEMLVHDLKSPLSSVIANSQFALECPEDAKEAIEDVLSAAGTMHQMVLNLLDIGGAEDGELHPTFEPLEVDRLLEQLQASCNRRMAARQQRLTIRRLGEVGTIQADGSLVSRMLQNLLENSIKHSPSGTEISVGVEATQGATIFRVQDTGPAIPDSQSRRVFEKYAHVDGEPPPERSSRALGLVFCRMAAEAHGGTIRTEASPEGGTSFVIELPTTTGHGTSARGPRVDTLPSTT